MNGRLRADSPSLTRLSTSSSVIISISLPVSRLTRAERIITPSQMAQVPGAQMIAAGSNALGRALSLWWAVAARMLGAKGATQHSRLARKHPAAGAHRFVQLIRTLLRARFGFVASHLFGSQLRGVTFRLRPQANHSSPDAWQRFNKRIHLHA